MPPQIVIRCRRHAARPGTRFWWYLCYCQIYKLYFEEILYRADHTVLEISIIILDEDSKSVDAT
eukprot:SAG31_NODE_39719_length_286_cov_0.818182_1_plen_63_part_01